MVGCIMEFFHGSCLCKRVQFEVSGVPFDDCICHCTDCRQACGAPFLAWVSFKADALTVTHGGPKWYDSSQKARRGFCGDCGTQLFFQNHKFPADIDIATACLAEASELAPTCHIWVRSKLDWVRVDDLPAYDTFRAPTGDT